MIKLRFLLVLVVMLLSLAVNAKERVLWQQGVEISADLMVGVERKISFPEGVRLGSKAKYAQMFKASLIDNVFYITAITVFNEKITLQGLESGRFYIIQASVSSDSGKAKDELIVHLEPEKGPQKVADNRVALAEGVSKKIAPIDLVQYVSQTLYAPSSALIEPTPSIKRVALKKRVVPNLYRGGYFKATVLGGWFGSGLYVTAVKLSNETASNLAFEPCRVRGDFYSAVVQFKKAYPKGHKHDFTVAYLLSRKPFDVAVLGGELKCV